jgi:hypothetical protein
MSRKDQTLRIVAALNGLFASDDVSPADQDRWRELKRRRATRTAYRPAARSEWIGGRP